MNLKLKRFICFLLVFIICFIFTIGSIAAPLTDKTASNSYVDFKNTWEYRLSAFVNTQMNKYHFSYYAVYYKSVGGEYFDGHFISPRSYDGGTGVGMLQTKLYVILYNVGTYGSFATDAWTLKKHRIITYDITSDLIDSAVYENSTSLTTDYYYQPANFIVSNNTQKNEPIGLLSTKLDYWNIYSNGGMGTYDEGYAAGYKVGGSLGELQGYGRGLSVGDSQGYARGLSANINYGIAYSQGKAAGHPVSYAEGYRDGFDSNTKNYNKGFEVGYKDGKADGLDTVVTNVMQGEKSLLTFTGSIIGSISAFVLYITQEISFFNVSILDGVLFLLGIVCVVLVVKFLL